MSKELDDKLFNLCIFSFVALVLLAILVNTVSVLTQFDTVLSAISLVLSLGFLLPGVYFWFKYLKVCLSNKPMNIGQLLLLLVFTIFYALFLEKKEN